MSTIPSVITSLNEDYVGNPLVLAVMRHEGCKMLLGIVWPEPSTTTSSPSSNQRVMSPLLASYWENLSLICTLGLSPGAGKTQDMTVDTLKHVPLVLCGNLWTHPLTRKFLEEKGYIKWPILLEYHVMVLLLLGGNHLLHLLHNDDSIQGDSRWSNDPMLQEVLPTFAVWRSIESLMVILSM